MTATAATNNTSGRTKKAVVAAALGIALLAGGGGTFAAWNESTSVAAGSVAAGHMNFTTGTTPVWTVSHNGGAPVVISDITTFQMVPGDVVTYKNTVSTNLVGQNLQANLTVVKGSVTGTLAPFVTISDPALYQSGTTTAAPTTLTPSNNATYDTVVTIELPAATAGSTAEDQTLDLAGLDLTLQQV